MKNVFSTIDDKLIDNIINLGCNYVNMSINRKKTKDEKQLENYYLEFLGSF